MNKDQLFILDDVYSVQIHTVLKEVHHGFRNVRSEYLQYLFITVSAEAYSIICVINGF